MCFTQSQDTMCYLVGPNVIIERPMKIFQVSLNRNCKEYLRANHTLAHVDI